MRRLLDAGASAVLVVTIMFVGSLVLWLGVPGLWLWVGAQVLDSTDSVPLGLLVIVIGIGASIWIVMSLLDALNGLYARIRVARGLDDLGQVPIEMAVTVSAFIALAVFLAWFLVIQGPAGVPFLTD